MKVLSNYCTVMVMTFYWHITCFYLLKYGITSYVSLSFDGTQLIVHAEVWRLWANAGHFGLSSPLLSSSHVLCIQFSFRYSLDLLDNVLHDWLFLHHCVYVSSHQFPLFRYALLTPETYPHWNGPIKEGIKHLMMSVSMEPDQWQLGRTKVFVKSPESVSENYTCSLVISLRKHFENI